MSSSVDRKNNMSSHTINQYQTALAGAVAKPQGHTQQPLPEGFVEQEGKRLYSITTIVRSDVFSSTRCVCVCDNLERAREIVETNEGDIWECSYGLCVIEATACNCLYGYMDEQYWYRWNVVAKVYEPVEVPPGYEGAVGFGVG
jgi:hypothetical protein